MFISYSTIFRAFIALNTHHARTHPSTQHTQAHTHTTRTHTRTPVFLITCMHRLVIECLPPQHYTGAGCARGVRMRVHERLCARACLRACDVHTTPVQSACVHVYACQHVRTCMCVCMPSRSSSYTNSRCTLRLPPRISPYRDRQLERLLRLKLAIHPPAADCTRADAGRLRRVAGRSSMSGASC